MVCYYTYALYPGAGWPVYICLLRYTMHMPTLGPFSYASFTVEVLIHSPIHQERASNCHCSRVSPKPSLLVVSGAVALLETMLLLSLFSSLGNTHLADILVY